jgi:PAS domain S-box-containing protein
MTENPDVRGEAVRSEQRARHLALEKSYLELVVRLMARVGAASGVQDVIESVLSNVLDVIGGTNIVLYYWLDGALTSADVYGARKVTTLDTDPVVRRAMETREAAEIVDDFAETRLTTPAFTKAFTWVFPLVAGNEVVGVLKMENLHIEMRPLYRTLPVFFNYLAQVLANEVRNYGRLQQAYTEASAANEALRREMGVRERVEEALRIAKAELERRVAARTSDLAAANERLESELRERVRAEADARRLRTAIEQSPDSVVITDAAGGAVYVNPSFCVVTGYSREEVIGNSPRILRSGEATEEFYREMWDSLTAGKTWRGRLPNRKKSGELFVEDAIITPVRDEQGAIVNFIALKRDVTRELEREEHLRHAQRLDAIGRLAGGVAHDFNNILSAMMMELELMQLEHELAPGVAAGVAEVRKAAERAASLTRQLLSFSRRQAMNVRPHDLNEIVRNELAMLARVLPESITLSFEPAPRPLPVAADAALVEQVIMNLVVNARDAMPAGGRLTIATGVEEVVEEQARPGGRRPGRFAILKVSDTGAGIGPDVIPHLFEPFFTTKDVGHGTGLGLATSHGIVSQHRGWIDVESDVGQGSAFTVYLPLSLEPVAEAPAPVVNVPTGHATILLVEDEATIRRMAQRCLERIGYHVIPAESGPGALEAWDRAGGQVDLLLTDEVMPQGVSGTELSRRLRSWKPDLRVILMSGYPADIARGGGALATDLAYLAKPFTLSDLAALVDRVLGQPAAPA